MDKRVGLLAASLFAFGAAGAAQARQVSYEIDGQRYSYESRDRKQAEDARKRIGAASAAEAAKRKAAAERSANPLVSVFGSQAQTEEKAAAARLQEIMATPPVQATADEKPRAAERAERRERNAGAPAARAKETRSAAKAAPAETGDPVARPSEPKAAAASAEPTRAAAPAVKSVHFDKVTGIKTTEMADGSIHEELFDSSALSEAGQAPAPEEATGTLAAKRARSN